MRITDFGVAVIEGDRLSGDVERAGTLACVDDWLQSFRPYIPEGGVVCDIGAAIGDHVGTYAEMVGVSGRVYAFEPYAPYFECLTHNITAPHVELHDEALAEFETRGTMVTTDVLTGNLGMTHLVKAPSGATRVTTLDRRAADWPRLDFVKIDVEGSEPLVLDGAVETLTRFHPVLLIEINAWALKTKGFTPEDVYRRLRALGYTFQSCHAGQTLDSPETDILCVPKAPAVVTTPATAPTRVHLLSVPNTQTTKAYELDGFCQRTIRFAALLKRLGHTVWLYGSEENDAPCDQLVSVISKAEQTTMVGETPYQNVPFEPSSPLFLTFNTRAANHIRSVKQPGDMIATIAGSAQAQIADSHPDLLFLEYSVGYQGIAPAAHRVYQSHAWRHVVHGFSGVVGGRLFDTVIPPWFTVDEFPAVAQPDPYVVYCGRLVHSKGISTVCDAAKAAGVKLLVIGHGDPALVTYGEYLGAVPTAERNRILSHATACLMPTQYIEPFGNVSAEAQLCGTPVLSTNYGAFVESVEQGVSGYRCDTLGEFVEAIHLAPSLDRAAIRRRAQRLYSDAAADAAYRAYFRRLDLLRGEGWRDLAPGLTLPLSQEPMTDELAA